MTEYETRLNVCFHRVLELLRFPLFLKDLAATFSTL